MQASTWYLIIGALVFVVFLAVRVYANKRTPQLLPAEPVHRGNCLIPGLRADSLVWLSADFNLRFDAVCKCAVVQNNGNESDRKCHIFYIWRKGRGERLPESMVVYEHPATPVCEHGVVVTARWTMARKVEGLVRDRQSEVLLEGNRWRVWVPPKIVVDPGSSVQIGDLLIHMERALNLNVAALEIHKQYVVVYYIRPIRPSHVEVLTALADELRNAARVPV
ncbi:MAG: hypothetical protein ACIAS6_01390 [Phycisphaerales bacterium JB060]